MTSAIVSFVGKQAGSFVLDYFKKALKGDKDPTLETIVKGQQSITDLNKALHLENLLWDSIQKIRHWTELLKTRLEKEVLLRKEAEAAGSPVPPLTDNNFKDVVLSSEMKSLLATLSSDNEGISFHLFNVWSGFTGQGTMLSHDSIISVICKEAYNKLSEVKNFDFTIPKYLDEIDNRFEQVAAIIRNGVILQAAAAASVSEGKDYATAAAAKLEDARTQTWNQFPALIRKLRPSYTAPFASDSRYYRFILDSKDRLLYMSQVYRGTPVAEWSMDVKDNAGAHWRFSQSLDRGHVKILSRRGEDPVGSTPGHTSVVNRDGAEKFRTYVWKVTPVKDDSRPDIPLISFSFPRYQDEMGKDTHDYSLSVFRSMHGSNLSVLNDEGIDPNMQSTPAKEASSCIVM